MRNGPATIAAPDMATEHLIETYHLPQQAAGRTAPSWRRTAFWLVLLAFAVRIGLMVGIKTYLFDDYRFDDYAYQNETTSIAKSIAEGHGFSSPFSDAYTGPTAWIGPIYPYLCAWFFRLFGVLTVPAGIALLTFQSAISALTCIPILGIAERTTGRRAGITAAVFWAVFPWFSKWALSWVWEISLSALLLACVLWYALRLAQPARLKAWAGFGALWGSALLVNPALVTLFPLSLLWCAVELRRRNLSWLKPALLAIAMSLLVISPWVARNRIVFGQWVFLRSNFGYEFWLGNGPKTSPRGWGGPHPSRNVVELEAYKRMGEVPYVRAKTQEAIAWVEQNKALFARNTADRVLYFWDGSAIGYRRKVAAYWQPWSFLVFSVLLLPSMLVAHRKQLFGWPLFFAVVIAYPLPYYLTYSQLRYRHALEPLMVLLLCYAVNETLTPLFRKARITARDGPVAL